MGKIKLLRYWGVVLLAVAFTAMAGESEKVRVGLAWQPNEASYERVILSIEAAGGEAVILPQMRPAGFEYDGMALCPKYVDESGVLLQEYADMVQRLCLIHLKNQADAEDIFQTVFLKYALSTVEFQDGEHEKPGSSASPSTPAAIC